MKNIARFSLIVLCFFIHSIGLSQCSTTVSFDVWLSASQSSNQNVELNGEVTSITFNLDFYGPGGEWPADMIVVIYSPKTNLMLLGNKVLWDNRAKRILSEENVTIVKVTENDQVPCVQKSIGFESDMDLSNYIFYNIKGQIGEDCF